MSLYYVQKFIYELNRDLRTQERFRADLEALLQEYDLTDEETEALRSQDILSIRLQNKKYASAR